VRTLGYWANYTYADGKQTSLVTNGDDRLVGNLEGYLQPEWVF